MLVTNSQTKNKCLSGAYNRLLCLSNVEFLSTATYLYYLSPIELTLVK